jgi:hypothetical protein
MRADLRAGSRHEHLILYDPASIPSDTPVDPDLDAQDPALMPGDAMRALAAGGLALILHIPEEDCEARLRLFVDEPPPDLIAQRGATVLTGAVLKVPTGCLKADGLEFLTRPGDARRHSEAETAIVPPGDYDIEVRELMSWKLQHGAAEIRRGAGPIARAVHTLTRVYTWLGLLTIVANFFLIPGIGVWYSRRGWGRSAWQTIASLLVFDALVLAGFWILEWARKRFPGIFRMADAEATFDRDHPDIAIVLGRRAIPARGSVPTFVRIPLTQKRL